MQTHLNSTYLADAVKSSKASLAQLRCAFKDYSETLDAMEWVLAGALNMLETQDDILNSPGVCLKMVNLCLEHLLNNCDQDISPEVLCVAFCMMRRNCEALNMCDGALPTVPHFISNRKRYYYPRIVGK